MKISNLVTAIAPVTGAYGTHVAEDPFPEELMPVGKNLPLPFQILQTASEYVEAKHLDPGAGSFDQSWQPCSHRPIQWLT